MQASPNPSRAGRLLRAVRIVSAITLLGSSAAIAAEPGTDNGSNWPQYHRTENGWRYSPLDQINTKNVQKLSVAWIHQPGDITQGLQATPITVDGILYYIGPNNRVFAVDAATGQEIWKYVTRLDPKTKDIFFAAASRGVTVGRGKVFFGTLDGRAIALDQKTGKELWQVPLTAFHTCQGCNFSSPPTLAGDVLVFGPTGGDLADAGHIFGVKADTGERAWTFDVLKDDPKSWPGKSRAVGGGGAWMPGQYDPDTGSVYIGTSNPAPDFDGAKRDGDNLYTASLLAIDAKTGKLNWAHQEVPHDLWDFDSVYETLQISSEGKDLLVHLNKGGYVSVLDKHNGNLSNVWAFARNINWTKGIDPETGEPISRNVPQADKEQVFCPSVLGARSWNAGAYNPKTKLWYTNAVEICTKVTMNTQEVGSLALAQPFFGASALDVSGPPGGKASARFDARDPLTGKIAWSIDYTSPALGSVLTTGGGLVFNGDSKGIVHAYDAENGSELWSFNTGSGIRGGITSYSVNGKQYIVVPSGFGSLFAGFAGELFPDYKKVNGGAALIAFTVN